MYLGYKDNKIKFYTKTPLYQELYNLDKVEETQDEYVLDGEEYVLKTDEYIEKQLQQAKEAKYIEANKGAKEYLESGNALYELEEGKHVEAFDGNMSKMTGYLLAFESGMYKPDDTVIWVTKEDETLHLTKEQIAQILKGIGEVQAYVWSVQFIAYKEKIENAKSIEAVNAITIEYNDDIPVPEPVKEPTKEL